MTAPPPVQPVLHHLQPGVVRTLRFVSPMPVERAPALTSKAHTVRRRTAPQINLPEEMVMSTIAAMLFGAKPGIFRGAAERYHRNIAAKFNTWQKLIALHSQLKHQPEAKNTPKLGEPEQPAAVVKEEPKLQNNIVRAPIRVRKDRDRPSS